MKTSELQGEALDRSVAKYPAIAQVFWFVSGNPILR
jgi:hypothetical protein